VICLIPVGGQSTALGWWYTDFFKLRANETINGGNPSAFLLKDDDSGEYSIEVDPRETHSRPLSSCGTGF